MCTTPFHVTDELGHEINVISLHFGPTKDECFAKAGDGHWYRVIWKNDDDARVTTFTPDTLILRN